MTSSATDPENLKASVLALHKIVFEASASIVQDATLVRFLIEITAVDGKTGEAKHGASPLLTGLHGPLCRSWTQKRLIAHDPQIQKDVKLSHDRVLSVHVQMSTYPATNDHFGSISSTTGALSAWNATEFAITPIYAGEKGWVVKLEFDPKTKYLTSVEMSYDPTQNEVILERLLCAATDSEMMRTMVLGDLALANRNKSI